MFVEGQVVEYICVCRGTCLYSMSVFVEGHVGAEAHRDSRTTHPSEVFLERQDHNT